MRKVTGSVAGMGISQNILECYQFIFENFNADDQIFLFGFSRGATTVRSLSGYLHLFGILPKSRPELIKEAYKIYKIGHREKRDVKAAEFVKRHHTMWCRIKFLGVWDTVAALGIPFKSIDVLMDKIPFFRHRFQDLMLKESVMHARHALAIDDERLTFHPTIWDPQIRENQTVKQVWFAGMHTDVGGGYPDPNSHMHNSRQGTFARFYRKKERSWDSDKRGKPILHESVIQRKLNKNNTASPPYNPWILKMNHFIEPWPESQRTHGHYPHFSEEQPQEKKPGGVVK